MSAGSLAKKPCGIYWDIGDSSVVGTSIKETVYLVRSVCQSNDLDDVSFQCVSSVNSISDYVDSDSIKLITVSDYSKANACAKIIQLIEQFLYEYEPGCPIVIIDPNNLFSTPLTNLSTRFDFEIYFIHLESTFDPSLESIADNHFYLEGSSIYPVGPLSVLEIGTLAIKNYPPTIDTFNLILEIDHLYKSYGRIENSTFRSPELAVVWVFFPSQQLAQNAAKETQEVTFRGSSLSIEYLRELPCKISDHPILVSLIFSYRTPSPEKIPASAGGDVPNADPVKRGNNLNLSTDQPIKTVQSTSNPSSLHVDSESSQSSNFPIVHELQPGQSSLDAAEILSQLSSANTTLNNTDENIQIINDCSVSPINPNDESSSGLQTISSTSLACSPPQDLSTSSLSNLTSKSSPPPQASKKTPAQNSTAQKNQGSSADLNSTRNTNGTLDKSSSSSVSTKEGPACPFGVISVKGRPKGVKEDKYFRDVHGLFKASGRLDDTTIIYNDTVLLGFPDKETAKRVAAEKNGMTYFGVPLRVSHIDKPSSNMISVMKNEPVPCAPKVINKIIQQDPNLIVTMKSLKRSASKSSIPIKSATDIGAITITNTPDNMEVRNLLSHLSGNFKGQGAIIDSAIWFKGTVWICFPDKKLARAAASKSNGMNFQGHKLNVKYIENPPKLLLETHFVCLLTPINFIEKSKSKSTKRARRSNSQQSSAKVSPSSGSTKVLSSSSSKSSIDTNQSSTKSVVSINSGHSSKEGTSKNEPKSGSNGSTNKPPNPSDSKEPTGPASSVKSKSNSNNTSVCALNNSSASEKSNGTQSQMDTKSGHGSKLPSRRESIEDHGEEVDGDSIDGCEDSEGSITYFRNTSIDPEAVERSCNNDTLDSYDSIENYMLSESIIYPVSGLTADSRFDYYQSSAYLTHDFSNLIKDSLRADHFVIFEGINFKSYPSKFWVFVHLLRLVWFHGVLKIAHIKNEVYILFATSEGAKSTLKMFNKSRSTGEQPNLKLFSPLEEIKASVPKTVPSSVITLIAMYSGTYSPWCFTENWDLYYLSLQVKDFVSADEYAISKAVVSNFGALFIKPRDSQMIVAFADEKRSIHTMLFMKQSVVSKFNFVPDPPRPADLLTLIRDYDLTGYCVRLSQIALQQTFKIIEFKLPPPFVIVQDCCSLNQSNVTRPDGKVEINFNLTSARTCETSPPIPSKSNDPIPQEDAVITPSTSKGPPGFPTLHLEKRVNYFLMIEYNARHVWCYMYDILSKLWCYGIVKITYKQDHLSKPAETWLEVPSHVEKDDLIKRLTAISYMKTPKTQFVVRPTFEIINYTISTGSSPWLFNPALQLKYLKVISTSCGGDDGPQDINIDIRTIKQIVEDEHAIFVKLLSNVIWISFPDTHSSLQGILLLNHEQRTETGLLAYATQEVPKDLLSSIDIEDLVGVTRDLAIANSLAGHGYYKK